MNNKVVSVLGAVAVSAALFAMTTQGCGGGGSGVNVADQCSKSCKKAVECSSGVLTQDQCVASCTNGAMSANGQHCTNEAALVSKANECLGKAACTDYFACLQTIPECEGATTGAAGSTSTGAAGSTSTGASGTTGHAGTTGSTGAAGLGATGAAGFIASFDGGFPAFDGGIPGIDASAGTTCATACVKADQCCTALGAASGQDSCTFKSDCDGTAAAQQSLFASSCNAFLQIAPLLSSPVPAACK